MRPPAPSGAPPRLAVWLLRRLLVAEDREPALGDLHEEYLGVEARHGALRAMVWYWTQVLAALGPGLARRLRAVVGGGGPVREARQAARALARRPGLSLAAVGTLGLGIGAATAIFSVVDAVLLRALPFPRGERLVTVWNTYDSWRGHPILDRFWDHVELSWPEFEEWSAGTAEFDRVAVYSTRQGTLTGAGDPVAITVGAASTELLRVLGTEPLLGRFFAAEEVGEGAPRLAVLSHSLWSERFGRNPGLLGRDVTLDGMSLQVIGILPESFALRALNAPPGWARHSLWVPAGALGEDLDRGNHRYEAIGLLASGATLEAAAAEAAPILRGDADPAARGARLAFRKDEEVGASRRPLLILLGSVGLLLVIACGNVAGLLLSEAARRRTELVTRAALGAGRARIARQLLTEGVLLGLAGAALGVVLAWIGVDALLRIAPPDLPLPESVGREPRILAVAVSLGIGAGALLGLLPGATSLGPDLAAALRGAGAAGSRSGERLQRAVVGAQLALSLVLLVPAGLLMRSLDLALRVDPGFEARDLVRARVALPPARYQGRAAQGAFFRDLRAQLEALPGIENVSGVSQLPFAGGDASSSFQIVGREVPNGEKQPEANRRTVFPDYHELMGIPLLAGRYLTPGDRVEEAPAIVVSRSMADRHWPDGDALGAHILRDRREFEVVGIVGDVLHNDLTGEVQATFYVPLDVAENRDALDLLVRSTLPLERTASLIREAVRGADPDLPVGDVAALTALLADSTRGQRFRVALLVVFSGAATLLAALGLFGSTTRMARARSRELGIRLALGARRPKLLLEVVRAESGMLAGGLAMGLAGAYFAAGQVRAYLFELSPADPVTWLASGAVLFTVALSSTLWAAGGAMRVDPVETLRAE